LRGDRRITQAQLTAQRDALLNTFHLAGPARKSMLWTSAGAANTVRICIKRAGVASDNS
jgi:hypothetical protein